MDTIQIAAQKDSCTGWIKISGRATLEAGDKLRVAGKLFLDNGVENLKFEMSECLFMDSTIMGVLAMLSLEAHKKNISVNSVNIKNEALALLKGLGVNRVMEFVETDTSFISWKELDSRYNKFIDSNVVLNAHKTLMSVDDSNVEKFEQVVKCLELEVGDN